MRLLLVLTTMFCWMFSLSAQARTQSIFSNDGSKVSVMIFGSAGDSDALALFDSMTVSAETINGKRTKRMNFDHNSGERGFSIVCVLSAYINESGSCTLILHAGSSTTIDKSASEALFRSTELGEVERLTAAFKVPGDSIYVSNEGHLRISIGQRDGAIQSFEILYR
ncbi:MAG: hypothetical protein HC883_04985 [Bdellovibrionaceae bacterium]|nr:hypothetical protein [Pseudobdellovibrionaceae bacterium]